MTTREGRVRGRWVRGTARAAAVAVLPGYAASGARGRKLAPVADEMPPDREVKGR